MSSCPVSVFFLSIQCMHRQIKFGCFTAGEVIVDGTEFRNTAHMRFKADLFVPCGGRYVAVH